jgi:hypothetical protein
MGGIGSGRCGRRAAHARVEDLPAFTVRELREKGLFAGEERASFERRVSRRHVTAHLRVSRTAQPFGGFRWWVHCPLCDRRKAKLHIEKWAPHPVACRTCHGLHYESQSLGLRYRWLKRAQRFYGRAGYDIVDGFCYKPKGMRWTTFNRLVERAREYEEAGLSLGLSRYNERFRK